MTLALPNATSATLPVAASASTTAGDHRRIPLTIPSDQEYYWHWHWQQAERETLAERDAGRGVRFDSDDPDDIVRWLDEPDE